MGTQRRNREDARRRMEDRAMRKTLNQLLAATDIEDFDDDWEEDDWDEDEFEDEWEDDYP